MWIIFICHDMSLFRPAMLMARRSMDRLLIVSVDLFTVLIFSAKTADLTALGFEMTCALIRALSHIMWLGYNNSMKYCSLSIFLLSTRISFIYRTPWSFKHRHYMSIALNQNCGRFARRSDQKIYKKCFYDSNRKFL